MILWSHEGFPYTPVTSEVQSGCDHELTALGLKDRNIRYPVPIKLLASSQALSKICAHDPFACVLQHGLILHRHFHQISY